MGFINSALSILLIALFSAQTQDTFYVESWKSGKQQIQEQSFTVEIDAVKPKFETKLMDASGKERYKLTLWFKANQFKAQQPFGYVELVEKDIIGFKSTNLLKPSNDPYQDYFTGKDSIAVLDPAMQGEGCTPTNGCVPFFVKRVIKVKGFYCIVQVSKYNESAASMTVQIELTNNLDHPFSQSPK